MNENIVTFLKKLEQDEAAQKMFSACRDPEEAYQMAHAIQDGFTKEEFIEAMKSLRDKVNADLSTEDLSKVSGGEGESLAFSAIAVNITAFTVYTAVEAGIISSSAAV